MKPLINNFIEQHQQCEQLFCYFEDSVAEQNWLLAKQKWQQFVTALVEHINYEQEELFAPFEQLLKNNSEDSPTKILRIEHQHLLTSIKKLEQLIPHKDIHLILEKADSLMIDFQQHVQHEEDGFFTIINH